MYSGYNKIFWGILITTFSINLGPIKILPVFIGFLFIVSGLDSVYKESSFNIFEKVKSIGMLVAFISFIGGVIDFTTYGMTNYSFINIIWITVFIIIELVFYFKIIEASIEYLSINNYDDLTEDYISKLRNYTIFSILNILFLSVSLILNLNIYPTIAAIIGVILKIYLMTMIYGLRNIFTKEKTNDTVA